MINWKNFNKKANKTQWHNTELLSSLEVCTNSIFYFANFTRCNYQFHSMVNAKQNETIKTSQE